MQPELADPYRALTQKLDGLMRKMNLLDGGTSHPVIERDVANIAAQLVRMAVSGQSASNGLPVTQAEKADLLRPSGQMPVPFVFIGNIFLRRGEARRAHICAARALGQSVSEDAFDLGFRALRKEWDAEFCTGIIDLLERSLHIFYNPLHASSSFALELLNAGQIEAAERLFRISDNVRAIRDRFVNSISDLNQAQLYRHRGKDVPETLMAKARAILVDETMPPVNRMGASIIVEDWAAAEEFLKLVCKTDPFLGSQVPTWPIFKLLIPHLKDAHLCSELVTIRNNYLSGHLSFTNSSDVDRITKLIK